jgi:hypothetical protein
MSTKTTTPDVPVDEPSTAETLAELEPGAAPTGDEPPFESPEFGVGGFFPHLEAATDG